MSKSVYLTLDPYSRHKQLINDYVLSKKAVPVTSRARPIRTDYDVLAEEHRFLRDEGERAETWGQRMAVKYYEKLFKEYAVADLTRYKENKIGLRWRTEREVFKGKGQFSCGNLACDSRDGLESFEVQFNYVETGEQKVALVKLRACPNCAPKLNYEKFKSLKKQRKRELKAASRAEKKRQRGSGAGSGARASGSASARSAGANAGAESETGSLDSSDDEHGAGGSFHNERQSPRKGENLDDATGGGSGHGVNDSHWKARPTMERSKEDEFDDYFDGMFM